MSPASRDQFDNGGDDGGDGTVTRDEFKRYYERHVSENVDQDDLFFEIVRRSWRFFDDEDERHEGKHTSSHFDGGGMDLAKQPIDQKEIAVNGI